ncbi:GLPGLI family protein [Spirosoma knui]
MKHRVLAISVLSLFITITLYAQSSSSDSRLAGKITYEGMRRIDFSQMRMVINGQEVRPGSPGAPEPPEGMPDVMSFTQKLVFSGAMAKEERDRPQNMMIRRTFGGGADGPGGGDRAGQPREMRMTPPFEQTTFLDLANRTTIDVLTMKKDSSTQVYRTERPMPKAEGWQLSDKTKKIAGYVCRKATATYRPMRRMMGGGPGAAPAERNDAAQSGPAETYTVWYTTDLPFTYSPVAGLTPEKGVVLQIESDNESFKATGVLMEAVPETAVQPPKDAKVVSSDEMNELRRKAMATFRQRMMNRN